MPKLRKQTLTLLLVTLLILLQFNWVSWPKAYANIYSCTASVLPHSVAPTSTTDFQFQINNTDLNTIRWIKVTRPSLNFRIGGYQVNGWSVNFTDITVTLREGALNPSESLSFIVQATSGSSQAPAANWTVEASDDPNGANPLSCSGDLGTEISGEAPDTTPPTIYNISLSNLTSNSITISWTTDEPATSTVYYGLDDNYGNEKSNPTPTLNHSIVLTNLSVDTAYHFTIESTDVAGNSGYSEDNTFLTPTLGSPVAPSVGFLTKKSLKQTEKTPPTIRISTVPNGPFKEAPKIEGEAEDNAGIFSIEYSTDDGRNWLPADKVDGLGGKKVSFEFTPQNLEDGNYITLARATDTSGNTADSNKVTLIIDQLPPIVGGNVVSIGPQVLEPSEQCVLVSLTGVDQKITLSAVGGPTSINLSAKDINNDKSAGSLFSLTKSADSGLWSGILSFKKPGTYNLTANSVDGAGNKLQRSLNTVFVSESPRVLGGKNNRPIEKARVALYYLEPDSNNWVVWDGAPYGQENPQVTDKEGNFKLFVPVGKYYLKVQAADYQTLVSDIFETKQSIPLITDLHLAETFKLKLGPIAVSLPSLSVQKINIETDLKLKTSLENKSLIEKEVPSFLLPSVGGGETSSLNLRGRPTIVTFVTTWAPPAKEQFSALTALQKNKDINVVPISVFESAAKIRVYSKISGYEINVLVDKDGETVEAFNLQNLPTHYFVDRKGIIKRVVVGVLSEKEILGKLVGL